MRNLIHQDSKAITPVSATSDISASLDCSTQRQAIAVALGVPVKDVRLDLGWQRSVVALEKKPEPLDTSAELEGGGHAV